MFTWVCVGKLEPFWFLLLDVVPGLAVLEGEQPRQRARHGLLVRVLRRHVDLTLKTKNTLHFTQLNPQEKPMNNTKTRCFNTFVSA